MGGGGGGGGGGGSPNFFHTYIWLGPFILGSVFGFKIFKFNILRGFPRIEYF